jgi:hypothetical protein
MKTDEEYMALLQKVDQRSRLATIAANLWSITKKGPDKHAMLKAAVESILGQTCKGDGYWQDFEFYGSILLPESTLTRPIEQGNDLDIHGGEGPVILLSCWADLTTILYEDYLALDLREKLLAAIEAANLTYIPERLLTLPYPGDYNAEKPTWGSRYFGFEM